MKTQMKVICEHWPTVRVQRLQSGFVNQRKKTNVIAKSI
eukprot:CAMPEP_0169420920 /NCGR_PEP_ID=MMETSP1017-20121227/65860_1 /TAXON_ID=342587 /ORGANISM="Karlodinium micrum, Strain CCMP2283" /LENGTH=38 /DNA_ID= /DNA_START= /DNA_END= /DNA_ORIENTATION=